MIPMTTNPLIGLRFGRLIALEETRVGHNRALLCQCDCGKRKTIRLSHLKAGRIKSCGCLMREDWDDGDEAWPAGETEFDGNPIEIAS